MNSKLTGNYNYISTQNIESGSSDDEADTMEKLYGNGGRGEVINTIVATEESTFDRDG